MEIGSLYSGSDGHSLTVFSGCNSSTFVHQFENDTTPTVVMKSDIVFANQHGQDSGRAGDCERLHIYEIQQPDIMYCKQQFMVQRNSSGPLCHFRTTVFLSNFNTKYKNICKISVINLLQCLFLKLFTTNGKE